MVVGLFQYDAYTEVGNSPGAVYAESIASSAVTSAILIDATSARDARKVSIVVLVGSNAQASTRIPPYTYIQARTVILTVVEKEASRTMWSTGNTCYARAPFNRRKLDHANG